MNLTSRLLLRVNDFVISSFIDSSLRTKNTFRVGRYGGIRGHVGDNFMYTDWLCETKNEKLCMNNYGHQFYSINEK